MLAVMFLVGIVGGCGGGKLYIPPEDKTTGTIVLMNGIYRPGFYVELDGMQAGFLKDTLEIKATPGKHTLKIFNSETTFREKTECVEHKFDLKLEVAQDDVKKITLAWDTEGYSKEVKNPSKGLDEPSKKKKLKEKTRENLPGMPPN
jgi:hypothetical protein